MNIVENIEKLIKLSGKTANAVLTECKLSHNSLIAWRSGKAKPSLDALSKLADYFDVTIDFIVGRETKESPSVQEIIYSQMSEDEIKLINAYRGMTLFDRATMKMSMVATFSMFRKKSNKNDLLTKEEMELLRKMQDNES